MKKINYIEVDTVNYYGDHFEINFFERGDYILENYPKSEDGNSLICDYGDGIIYHFLFEDNAKSFSEALNNCAKLMKKEGIDPCLNYKDVADLAKLIADVYLGEELYSNFKTNIQFYKSLCSIAFEKRLNGFDELLSHKPFYSSGNEVCFFGSENMMDLIQKPEEFNRRLIAYSFKKNLVDILKYLGIKDEEIKAKQLKLKKAALKTKIKKTEALLKKQKAQLKALESEE